MIKMIASVYGLREKQPNGKVRTVGKGPDSAPFSAGIEEEERLVKSGLAVYVDDAPTDFDEAPELPELPEGVNGIPEYSEDTSAKELREIGKMCGLTFKANMTKAEMVAALDEHIAAYTVEGISVDDEGALAFDAAEAVQ